MAYTPSTTFNFSPGSYTPGTTFSFNTSEAVTGDISATLDGVTGTLAGYSFAPGTVLGTLAGQLQGVSAELVGHIAAQGILSAQLDGLTGQFIAAFVPQGQLTATLDSITGAFQGLNVANMGQINATMQGVGGYLFAEYDSNVPRFTVGNVNSILQDTGTLTHATNASIDQTTRIDHAAALPHTIATPINPAAQLVYGHTTKNHIKRCGTVADAMPLTANIQSIQDLLQWAAKYWQFHAEDATPIDASAAAVVQQMTKIRPPDWRHPVQDSSTTRHDFIKTIAAEPEDPWRYTPSTAFSLSANPEYTPTHVFYWPNVVPRINLAMRHVVGIDGLSFLAPRQQAGQTKTKRCIPVEQARRPPPGQSVLPEPERPPYEPPPSHITVTIPTQQVYTMQHIISVKTVQGNVELPMSNVSLSYDADSFAWQFSGTLLDAAALALVQSTSAVELAVTIDGYIWHVLVESIEHGIQFAKHSITLKGRSLTAELGAPYLLPTSATIGDLLTVQQLADSLMPVGWSITWDAPVWNVPAGAFSYTNQTPIQVLASLVNDIGCVAIPHPSQRSITVQRRYPVYPWYFSAAPADLAIPEAALSSVNLRPAIATQANGVYVHGEIGGVLGWCRLAGTDGAKLAATVSNSLMTDVIGCRLLGERILSGQQTQPVIKSATLPIDGDVFPLASVGDFVQITLGADNIKGVVNSIAVDASLSKVSQTLQIGEETANVWTAFSGLLPRDPLLVGTIASVTGDISVVTLLDNGVVSVRGTGTVGSKVYIRAGRIEGPAPSMMQNEIVI